MIRFFAIVAALACAACSALFDAAPSSEQDSGSDLPADAALGDADPGEFDAGAVDAGSVEEHELILEQANNDAVVFFERAELATVFNGDDLDLGASHVNATFQERTLVVMRFEALPVPQGAEILEARLQLTAQETQGGTLTLDISLENDISPLEMNTNIPTLLTRSQSVVGDTPWLIDEQWQINESGSAQRSPSFADQLQSLVNIPEWEAGSDIVLFLINAESSTETRPVYSSEGAGSASQRPRLRLRFVP